MQQGAGHDEPLIRLRNGSAARECAIRRGPAAGPGLGSLHQLAATRHRALILIATSSVYQHQADLLQRIAHPLGQLPVQATLTTGQAIDPRRIVAPPNVEVVQAAPHRRILTEASAVITHAGHGSVLKSLAAGVPLVCIPMGRDQKDNTVRVLRLRAGIRLNERSTSSQIAAAVTKILHNPQYAAAARSFAEVLTHEAATTPDAADEAEGLLRR